MYPGQPPVARILINLGVAVYGPGMLDQSLRYFQEAKEILDNHIDVEYLRATVLNNIGTCYYELDKFLLAFQSYKDALDMTMISGNPYNTLCGNMTNTILHLSLAQKIQTRIISHSKEHIFLEIDEDDEIDEPFEIDIKMPITKEKCSGFVNTRYKTILFCKGHEERDKVLKYLEKAREIAKRFDYKCGRMVLVLLLLSMTYGEIGCFDKLRSYYEEAKEMANILPPDDYSILPGELGMIESMKKNIREATILNDGKFLSMLFCFSLYWYYRQDWSISLSVCRTCFQ